MSTSMSNGNGRSLADMRSSAPQPVARPAPARQASPAVAPEAAMPIIGIGFGNLQQWEFTQRVARGLSMSTLVPEAYRAVVPKGKFGAARNQLVENPSALSNCIIALNMAARLNADPLMVMQHLYIVEGRPAWSAQFVIAAINSCGRFSTLSFRLKHGEEQEVPYVFSEWDESAGSKVQRSKKIKVQAMTCIAVATDRATGELVEGPPVTMEMAVKEGWYDKNGSKWQTMPEVMIRYRAASFFGRAYCPEVLMGLRTEEEVREIIEAEQASDGSWTVEPAAAGEIQPDLADIQGAAEPVQSTAAIAHEEQAADPVATGLERAQQREPAATSPQAKPADEPRQAARAADQRPLAESMPGGAAQGANLFGDAE